MLTLFCLIIGIVIVLFAMAIIALLFFPGPSKYYPPPPPQPYYHQQPYQSPYLQREYPASSQKPEENELKEREEPVKHCESCGKQIPFDSKLCPFCGAEGPSD